MDPNETLQGIIAFVRENRTWAPLVVFLISFGESLAFLSILVPATILLLGIGALVGTGALSLPSLWAAAAGGAFLGYWASYWIGLTLGPEALRRWPLDRQPAAVARAERFFERYGALSVFIGHFFGPVRAVLPLIAGILRMRPLPFQLANAASAMLWAYLVLASGNAGGNALGRLHELMAR